CHLTGRSKCLLACLVGGQRLELHELDADPAATAVLLELLERFVTNVRTNQPPPPDRSETAPAAVLAPYPHAEDKRTMRLSRAEWEMVGELRERKAQLAEVKEQITELENHLKLAMGSATLAISPLDTDALKWGNVRQNRIDTTRLREEAPEVAE